MVSASGSLPGGLTTDSQRGVHLDDDEGKSTRGTDD